MNCVSCDEVLKGKSKKYCTNACQQHHQNKTYIVEWKAGIKSCLKYIGEVSNHVRRYLQEINDCKCAKCGWGEINPVTQKIPLTVNHIDGRSDNNVLENLELICPNCHSLTPTYGSLNRGKGRKHR